VLCYSSRKKERNQKKGISFSCIKSKKKTTLQQRMSLEGNRFALLEDAGSAAPRAAAAKKNSAKKPAAATTRAAPASGARVSRDVRSHGAAKLAGGRGAAGGAARGGNKRTFDKYSHSGKGQFAKDKKGGSGRGNWGGLSEKELQAEASAAPAGADGAAVEGGAAAAAAADGGEEEREKAVEEVDNSIELAEFLAQQRKEQAALAKEEAEAAKKVRRAGEGEDASVWSDYQPLQKEDVVEELFTMNKKSKASKRRAKKQGGAEKLPTQFRLPSLDSQDERRGGDRRGGRGGDRRGGSERRGGGSDRRGSSRGGRGGSSQRGGRGGAPVKINDSAAFPGLPGGKRLQPVAVSGSSAAQ
jgi:plasminogen activator inhibitor 1 RNA-binding protein